jgi:hypothetical protein
MSSKQELKGLIELALDDYLESPVASNIDALVGFIDDSDSYGVAREEAAGYVAGRINAQFVEVPELAITAWSEVLSDNYGPAIKLFNRYDQPLRSIEELIYQVQQRCYQGENNIASDVDVFWSDVAVPYNYLFLGLSEHLVFGSSRSHQARADSILGYAIFNMIPKTALQKHRWMNPATEKIFDIFVGRYKRLKARLNKQHTLRNKLGKVAESGFKARYEGYMDAAIKGLGLPFPDSTFEKIRAKADSIFRSNSQV